ncbi:response regulator [Pontibacter toksunensis]|uniref:Response regulator n=1 Tax=Pontibacter toksunensis TaxID=1332631 RepID=A0ABW6BN66_9BACT
MDFLLIDDESITLFLYKKLFQLEGLSDKVIAFDDPEEALEFLQQQISSGQVPQVIFLDLNMPKISGWDLLRALEPYEEQLQAKCLIYLLTSSLDPSDIARAKEHPLVTELIHKPLDRHIIHKVQKNMRGSR